MQCGAQSVSAAVGRANAGTAADGMPETCNHTLGSALDVAVNAIHAKNLKHAKGRRTHIRPRGRSRR